jgi:hypothetical protein
MQLQNWRRKGHIKIQDEGRSGHANPESCQQETPPTLERVRSSVANLFGWDTVEQWYYIKDELHKCVVVRKGSCDFIKAEENHRQCFTEIRVRESAEQR